MAENIKIGKSTFEGVKKVVFDDVDEINVVEFVIPKEEQEKTVAAPDFSEGNIEVTPDENKVLTKVTLDKDQNLAEGNIKDGVTIFGVEGNYTGLEEDTPYDIGGMIIARIHNWQEEGGKFLIYQAEDGSGTNAQLIATLSSDSLNLLPITLDGYYMWDTNGFANEVVDGKLYNLDSTAPSTDEGWAANTWKKFEAGFVGLISGYDDNN